MRTLPFLSVAMAALVVSGPVLAQPPEDLRPGWAQDAMDLAQEAGMFGPLVVDENRIRGAFVEAVMDPTTGGLMDYRLVAGVVRFPVFARVAVDADPGACVSVDDGPASVTWACSAVSVRVHNDPTRALLYHATGGPVGLNLTAAPDVFLAPQSGSVLVAGTGFRGQVTLLGSEADGSGLLEVSGPDLRVSLPQGAKLAFRAQPQDDEGAVGSWAQDAIFRSLDRHRLGGELFLVALEGSVMKDAVPYGDLTFASRLVAPDRLEIEVVGDRPTGALVAVNLHRDVLDFQDLDRLVVELDGVPLERTHNVDILPDASNEEPLYYAARGPNGLLLLVHLPELSTRVLTIRQLVDPLFLEPTTQTLLLVGLGALVTVLAAAVLFRRGREGW